MQAFMHASQAIAHIRHVSLISACELHSVIHARHIAIHASSMGIIVSLDMLVGRIIMVIMVEHTSAHMADVEAHRPMPSIPAIASEHIVHACIAAEHASMHSCMLIMSIPAMESMLIMFFIISSLMRIVFSVSCW